MRLKIFLPHGSINDATEHYISLIEKSLQNVGVRPVRVTSPKEVLNNDLILTVTPLNVLTLKLLGKKFDFINWFQGIGPEEYLVLHQGGSLRPRVVVAMLRIAEKYALEHSILNIFVSQAMEQHFINKHRHIRYRPSVVMPCYNKLLRSSSFNSDDKYSHPRFVYAGGLHGWQSIERTLNIFRIIERKMPDSELTVLTRDVGDALKMLDKYGVTRAQVKYVPLELLDEEISKHKYGFLIRENNIINNVATPTKMNTYLANGIMPIYTDVISAFEANLDLGHYCVKFSPDLSDEAVADLIFKNHQTKIYCDEIYDHYSGLFDEYYNDSLYVDRLSESFKAVVEGLRAR